MNIQCNVYTNYLYIRALIELPEVIIKALHRNALSSKDAIEICMKILEVKMESLLYILIIFKRTF